MTTDDLLSRAELLNDGHNVASLPSDGQMALDLLPDLISEVKRLQAACSRLEAAYLRETRIRMAAENRYTEPSDWEDEARESLEQIKRGEQG